MKSAAWALLALAWAGCESTNVVYAPTTGGSIGGSTGTGSGTTGGSSGALLPDGGNQLLGVQAFPVAWGVMDPAVPADQCYEDVIPSGQLDAVALELFAVDVSFAYCGLVGPSGVEASNSVQIQIASTGYVGNQNSRGDAGGAVPLAPGVYPIGDEQAPEEDLCSLPPNGLATLVSYNSNDGGVLWALSGNVTIASIWDAGITGSFDVALGWWGGMPQLMFDAGELQGTFDVSTCPGGG